MPAPDKPRASVTATEAKHAFGRLLEKAMQGGVVVITKHDAPKAVLISMEKYTALSNGSESRINSLTSEFDSMLMRMQGPKARNAMKRAFHASPKQLGKAAVTVPQRRG